MNTLLLVANYDSNVGYAWWLMESFWVKLAEHYRPYVRVVLAYPSISTLPDAISKAHLETVEQDFSKKNLHKLFKQCLFLRTHKVKALYLSDRPTWNVRYALFRFCGVRLIIVHDHTPGVRTPPRGIKAMLKSIVHRIPWLRADGAIGATDFVRQRLIEVNGMPADRCFAAPNGLPELSSQPSAIDLHDMFAIPRHRKILVMASRAHGYKGVDFALECLERLRDSGRDDVHFLFIGDGPHLQSFKKLVEEKDIKGHCTYAGQRNDVGSLLAGADIAFHPSRGEVGYSLSILEYMRAGLPVVVPDDPSVCGAIEHKVTGLIYPEGNVQKAILALEMLLTDKHFRKKLGASAKRNSSKYSLQETQKSLLYAFESIDRYEILKRNS